MQLQIEHIIEGCKKGKQLAQSELFRLFSPKLMGICYRYAGNRETAEDLLQEIFVKIFKNIESYRGDGSFEGWLRMITVNTCITWVNKNNKAAKEIELSAKYDKTIVDENESENDHYPISTNDLMKYIAELPDGYRIVLNMFAIEGYSHKQIGEQLGISESTSRSQYVRAKNYLSKKIMEKIKK